MQNQEIRQTKTRRGACRDKVRQKPSWFSGAETAQACVCAGMPWLLKPTVTRTKRPTLKTPLLAAEDDVAETPAHSYVR